MLDILFSFFLSAKKLNKHHPQVEQSKKGRDLKHGVFTGLPAQMNTCRLCVYSEWVYLSRPGSPQLIPFPPQDGHIYTG
jgi:hypothetical protein